MKRGAIWFDIPVSDMARARKFYADILGEEVAEMPETNGTVAFLPMEPGGYGGDLALGENQKPGQWGATVYFDGDPDLQVILDRVEPAGGKILQPKSFMGDVVGNIAFFLDTEGNRIGLHSAK
jgi:predicted enzyme related to lactoylglutathione lyase